MKSTKKSGIVIAYIISVTLLIPAKGFTNAYFIDSMNGKATGMADAFTAVADNPAAVYYNPAGIVQLEGTQVMSSLTFVDINKATFTSNGTSLFGTNNQETEARPTQAYIPSLFATHKLNDSLSLGFGIFSNFGLSTNWPDGWEGRYISGGTNSQISTVSLNPVIAYRLNKGLSISAGPVFQRAEALIENKVPVVVGDTVYPDANLELSANDTVSFGYNIALLAWLTDSIKVGMSYRSAMRHELEGDIDITGTPGGAGDVSDDASMTITLPALLYTGFAYTKGPLAVDLDVLWVQWSTIHEDSVDFDTLPTSNTYKGWNNTLTYRLGTSYDITEAYALRCGAEYSSNPIPDDTVEPTTPTNDRWRLSIGGGYRSGRFSLDLAYNYFFWIEKRDYDNATGDYGAAGRVTGKFNVPAQLVAATVGYKF
jgi:long-chain fatty acid transport protein